MVKKGKKGDNDSQHSQRQLQEQYEEEEQARMKDAAEDNHDRPIRQQAKQNRGMKENLKCGYIDVTYLVLRSPTNHEHRRARIFTC